VQPYPSGLIPMRMINLTVLHCSGHRLPASNASLTLDSGGSGGRDRRRLFCMGKTVIN
jgi:hypothetical protein